MSDTHPREHAAGDGLQPPVLALGARMPAMPGTLPVLMEQVVGGTSAGSHAEAGHSRIQAGMRFTGDAILAGVCTIAGHVDGNLRRAAQARATVVVTETGSVVGDIEADQISVMGSTEGTLEASGGAVTLHESARVSGRVRYDRLQVNGSDLNATLERVPARPAPAGERE